MNISYMHMIGTKVDHIMKLEIGGTTDRIHRSTLAGRKVV